MTSSAPNETGAEWMGLKQVSQYASLSARTIRSRIHDPIDPLPAVRVHGKILVRRSQLDAWLERRRIQPLENIDLDAIMKGVISERANGR